MLQIQNKLKAANKQKLHLERQLYRLSNNERTLLEELYSVKGEIDLITEQLEELKDKISETTYQISQLEIQKAATGSKIQSYISTLNNHKMGFDRMFDAERTASELRHKELQQKEAEEQEADRQRKKEIDRENELKAAEACAVEEECTSIERECSVLKKRNNAIMLKLRKKLIETEDARREFMGKNVENSDK